MINKDIVIQLGSMWQLATFLMALQMKIIKRFLL
jgi:hypothetical protein